MRGLCLYAMMFLQFLMLPVWVVPLLPYVGKLDGGGSWVFACGLLMGIGTFASPLVGMFADRFANAERVLALCNLATALLLAIAFFVTSPALLFVILLVTMLVYMPTWSVSSAIALAHAPPAAFARIRACGSLGWVASGVFSVIGAKCFGLTDFDSTHWIFAAGAGSALVAALLALTLPATLPKAKGTPMCVADALGLKAFVLFKDPRFAVFGVLITLAMLPFYWYVSYNALYLAESGFSYLTLTQNLGQVGEIGFMLLVPVIIHKFGYRAAMTLGILAVAVRYVFFYFAAAFGFAAGDFVGILLHGLPFGLLCIGSQMYVEKVAPPAIRSQAQGLIMLLTSGVGLFASNFLFDRILASAALPTGGHDWRIPFVIAGVMSALLAVAMNAFFRPDKRD